MFMSWYFFVHNPEPSHFTFKITVQLFKSPVVSLASVLFLYYVSENNFFKNVLVVVSEDKEQIMLMPLVFAGKFKYLF